MLIAVAASDEDYGDALEFARKKAELLHAAQLAGKRITPELTAEIDQLAQAYVTAGMNAEAAAEKLDRIKEQSERGKSALEGMFSSVIDGSKSAKQAFADLLMEIAKTQFIKGIWAGTCQRHRRAAGPGLCLGRHARADRASPASAARNWKPHRPRPHLDRHQTRTMLAGPAPAAPQQGGTSVQYVEVPYIARVDADDGGKLVARMERIADTSAAAMASNIDKALPDCVQQIQARPWRRR